MSKWSERLEETQSNWKTGKDEAPGIPAGEFLMQLVDAEIKESKSSGNLMISRKHMVIEGEYKGEDVYDNMMIETDRGPYYIAKWVRAVGFEPPAKLSDLENVLADIVEASPVVLANVKISGDFRNVNVRSLAEGGEAPPTTTPKASTSRGEPRSRKQAAVVAEPEHGLVIGDVVKFTDAGKEYSGEVVELGATEAGIEIEGDGVWDWPYEDLVKAEPEATTPRRRRKAATPEPEPESAEEPVDRKALLLAFCQSQEIEKVSDKTSENSLIKKIKEWEYPKAELTKGEIKLLEEIEAVLI